MEPEPREELDLTRALLAQARAERDLLQARVHDLEDTVRFLRRIPGSGGVQRLRRQVGAKRPRRSPPTPPEAPPLPGRYLDVSVLSEGIRTGIPRVTIELARRLDAGLVAMRNGHLVHDVTFVREIHGRAPSPDETALDGMALRPVPGVTVIDPAIPLADTFDPWQQRIQEIKSGGGRYVAVVHDVLPVLMPDFFDSGMRERFPRWLSFVMDNADLILAVSDATAAALTSWRPTHPPVVTCRSGSDSLPPTDVERTGDGRTLLAVGTVEPRKAVDVVVSAVEELRSRGIPVRLVVVGSPGWASPDLVARLEELGGRDWFEWVQDADDHALAAAYATADLLVAASRGEGYGLPLVEARSAGLPVVARDIPAFREALDGDGLLFGSDTDLADALERALSEPPPCTPAATRTWDEAIADVEAALDQLPPGR